MHYATEKNTLLGQLQQTTDWIIHWLYHVLQSTLQHQFGKADSLCGVYKIVKICKDRVCTLDETKLHLKKRNYTLLMAKPLADKMSIALHTAAPNIEDV